jgi:hypothetical protein
MSSQVGAPPGLSKRSLELWTELQAMYEFTVADEAILRRSLEAYDLHDELQAGARKVGRSSKDARSLLGAARDAALVGLRHWAALGFPKADLGATRRPGRPSGDDWSRQRRQARARVTGRPLGGTA